jgi:hypothetical protein
MSMMTQEELLLEEEQSKRSSSAESETVSFGYASKTVTLSSVSSPEMSRTFSSDELFAIHAALKYSVRMGHTELRPVALKLHSFLQDLATDDVV